MNSAEARKEIEEYLREHFIEYQIILCNGSWELYICVEGMPNVIGGAIETSLVFDAKGLLCKSYYCQPIVKTEGEIDRAARIITYLNHNLNWDCNDLYEHTYGMIEQDGDIYNYCYCRYELVEKYFFETMNHILNYSVQQLADVCLPLIGYICGKFSHFEATKVRIDHNIKGCPIPTTEDD